MKKFMSVLIAAIVFASSTLCYASDLQFQSNGTNLGIASKFNVVGASATRSGLVVTEDNTKGGPGGGFGSYSIRTRVPIASVNTGVTLLAAFAGRKYRIVDAQVIAIGANTTSTTATGVAVSCTQAASVVAVYTVAKAQLTRSAENRFGTASTTILADGASQTACDSNTAVTFAAAGGSDLAGATNMDVILDYSLE